MSERRASVRRASLALGALLCVPLIPARAVAHELRPAYLQVRESRSGEFEVLWKTPARGALRLALSAEISGRSEAVGPVATHRTDAAVVQTWRLRSSEPMRGRTVRIDGLEGTMTDVLVRFQFADGTSWTQRLTPSMPAAVIPARESGLGVARTYLALGVEHILTGVDHLLFVLALLLVTRGGWRLAGTVTAFTAAHSITLGLAALGVVHVSPAPTEAVIALSIVFVAAEILRGRRGHEGLTARAPWIVAFAFGLLHGFGFAGALGEIGLPQHAIPLALLCFNAGVEIGQLAFVAALLGASGVLGRAKLPWPRWAELAPAYAIGSVATFWVMQRVAAF